MTHYLLGSIAILLALVACGGAVVSLVYSLDALRNSPSATLKELAELRLTVADIIDRVDHWQRRDRVRRVRAGNADAELNALNGDASNDQPSKEELRRIAFGG